ncbi:hypothetical protein [Natrononativus amylolyticus]|uniref:hypothetical protein n=1 Tax=Natrononativus amylolyticus TaxID=2963434 RepID=UPI0020CE21C8|nr:hypothetical protein [Natrononativus amylolyticus]
MKRRAVLAGCSDPSTTIRLEAHSPEAVGTPVDGGRDWSISFDLEYELTGLNETDGLYGVGSFLVDSDGNVLERIEHGDLAWNALAADERETTESEDGFEFYRGTVRETVSAATDRPPRWIVFTADRADGARSSVRVYGLAVDDALELPSIDGDCERVIADREEIEITDDDWDQIRLGRYTSFPPTDEIPSEETEADAAKATTEATVVNDTTNETTDGASNRSKTRDAVPEGGCASDNETTATDNKTPANASAED